MFTFGVVFTYMMILDLINERYKKYDKNSKNSLYITIVTSVVIWVVILINLN